MLYQSYNTPSHAITKFTQYKIYNHGSYSKISPFLYWMPFLYSINCYARLYDLPLLILQVLYMSNNSVKDWGEFQKLGELQKLEDLVFVGKKL